MALDLGLLTEFVNRYKEIQVKKGEQKKLQEKNNKIEELLIDGMIESGIKNLNIGDRSVGIRTQLWASALDVEDASGTTYKDWPRACAALTAHGHGDLEETKVNAMRLSSLIRELEGTDEGIPESLASELKISEVQKLIVKK